MALFKRIGGGSFLRATFRPGAWLLLVATAVADDGPTPGPSGFQGFGIGYHLGYGYGGGGLGVGPDGGSPFYGGPGYPHPAPRLRRIGGIDPFSYFGGPGRNCPGQCNFFEMTGALVADPPVIKVEGEPDEAEDGSGYGPYTGTLPYGEDAFAPYTALGGSHGGPSRPGSVAPAPSPPKSVQEAPTPAAPFSASSPDVHSFGIDSESAVHDRGVKGLKVNKITPGSPADLAGLHVGDIIESVNERVTQQPGHLTWIIANAGPDKILKMSIFKVSDRARSLLVAHLP